MKAINYDHMDFDNALKCYYCKDDNLHQTHVEVFFRAEDAPVGLVVDVSADGAGMIPEGDQEANPSPRRDGIAITLWCESCDSHSFYNIVQHKGFTIPFMTGLPREESE